MEGKTVEEAKRGRKTYEGQREPPFSLEKGNRNLLAKINPLREKASKSEQLWKEGDLAAEQEGKLPHR